MRNYRLLFVAAVAATACETQEPVEASKAVGTLATTQGAVEAVTLNTFDNRSLQIDNLANPTNPSGDANNFVGNDPADGSASANKPTGGPSTWIDWNDLGGDLANHRFRDLNGPDGKDPTAFPGSNECVAPAQVLSKMDLTYVGASNNLKWAYFTVQRASNNGDAGYYWIFTKTPPSLTQGEAPCSATQQRLTYDIQPGDVLLAGHFHPSSTPLFQAFKAIATAPHTDAVNAVNYKNTAVWEAQPAAVGAVAVNTSITAPGAFGTAGIIKTALKNGNLDVELQAEAAVDTNLFTGGTPCGAKFYNMVITRSSGSGGTSPDLKDTAGPSVINFGVTTATATLTPTCGLGFGYSASATGFDGQPIANPVCNWSFSDGSTSNSCNGNHDSAPGTLTGSVTVTDGVCSVTQASNPVLVTTPIEVAADVTPTCGLQVGYAATATGGSGNQTYAWEFAGSGTTEPVTSSSQSGTVTVGANGTYTGTVTVRDSRTDIVCTASDSDTASAAQALTVTAQLSATCNDSFNYTATASGGSASATYAWTFAGGGTVSAATSSTQSGTILTGTGNVDYTGTVTVTDDRGDITCSASDSDTARPFSPLAVAIAPAAGGGMCPSLASDAATWTSSASGGNGSYIYTWNGANCSGSSCTIAPPLGSLCYDQSFTLTLSDSSGLCSATSSNLGQYSKTTLINVQ